MSIQWLDEIDQELLVGKNVFCRLDLNVPLNEDNSISDALRIELALPTIRRLIKAQSKIIIASHLGRPKGKQKIALSLEPVAHYLRDLLNQDITFIHDCVGDAILRIVNDQPLASVIMLENLRFHPGEEKNDPVFAKLLARGMDFYVNDAFGVVHRAHASVDGVTKFFSAPMGGLLLKKELDNFEKIQKNPLKPFVAVIGGSKVSTKIQALVQLIKKVDALLIGGAMAYTFLKAQGFNVGASMVEEEQLALAQALLRKAEEYNTRIYLPVDHVVASTKESEHIRVIKSADFDSQDKGFDIGPQTIYDYKNLINQARMVFFNGPVGMCEQKAFADGTDELIKTLAHADAYTIIGGGDTIAACNRLNLIKSMDFVSSGGGASLELLEGKKLPGLVALGYYS
jgi:phosphoglycerate kinase